MTAPRWERRLMKVAVALCAASFVAQVVAPWMPRNLVRERQWLSPSARHHADWAIGWNAWAVEVGHSWVDETFVSDAQREAWRRTDPERPWPRFPVEGRGPEWSYGTGGRLYAGVEHLDRSHIRLVGPFVGAESWTGGWSLRVPFWLMLLVGTAGLLCVAMARINRRIMRGGPAETTRCPSCGYDLRATPARCPECGRAVTGGVTV